MIHSILATHATTAELMRTNYGTFRGWVRHLLAQAELTVGRIDKFIVLHPAEVQRLVFVCQGNINRSPFAEWVARKHGAMACSLGLATTTGAPAFEKAQRTAKRFSTDLSAHGATNFKDYRFQPGDVLFAMEVRHAKELLARGIPEDSVVLLGAWSTPRRIHLHDPHSLSDRYFLTCFALIHIAVINVIEELRSAGSPCIQS